jgi:hypothetical protein
LTGAPLGDEGIAMLLPLIAEHFPSLTHLNLTACRISAQSLPEVVKWIKRAEMQWPRKLLYVELQYQNMNMMSGLKEFKAGVKEAQDEKSMIKFKL